MSLCSASQVSLRTTQHLSELPYFLTFRTRILKSSSLAVSSYPFDRIKRLYDINVHGAFFTAREAARNMIPQGGGSIVLVASMSANVSCNLLNLLLLLGTNPIWVSRSSTFLRYYYFFSHSSAVHTLSCQPQTPYNASKAGGSNIYSCRKP